MKSDCQEIQNKKEILKLIHINKYGSYIQHLLTILLFFTDTHYRVCTPSKGGCELLDNSIKFKRLD